MPSLLPGFEYDVFISYRQKDNKHDGWVTDFVENLQDELESTFKEDISIYFDINPRDGLLETHDVAASLSEKLKCLVFIPLISRTYCDPRSYAWEHEFSEFLLQATNSRPGLKVKLQDGNFASRLLPVIIYDLDYEDINLCETLLKGPLRGIEFIYRESGVNRPLTLKDKQEKNLCNTTYRNQINKVANAINGIIMGMKAGESVTHAIHENILQVKQKSDSLERSIAVLPFADMTREKDQDYFCDGMAEEIINALAHNEKLKVISRTSAFAFKNKHEDIREIGRKLGVETLLEGSIRKAGDRIRITAQLIKVEDGSHLWSDHFDREARDVFALQDEISSAIMDNLKVKLLGERNTMISRLHSENIEAYNLYLRGTLFWQMFTPEGYRKAAECFEQALKKDPGYALAYIGLGYVMGYSTAWGNLPPDVGWPRIHEYMKKAISLDKNLCEAYSAVGGLNVYYYWNWKEAERNYRIALQINPNSSLTHLDYSNFLTFNKRHDEAIAEAKKAQELDPFSIYINTYTGFAYDYAGQSDKAIGEFRKTLAINPDYFITHYHLGRAYSSKGMIAESIAEYEKAVEISGGSTLPVTVLICSYLLTGKKDKAEVLFENLRKKSEKEYVPATNFYLICRVRGEEENALKWLKKACRDHDTLLPWFRAHNFLIPEGSVYMKVLNEAGLGR